MDNKIQFARECTMYAREHNLPFQMVLALKMSNKKIDMAIKQLKSLNLKILGMSFEEQEYLYHNLHEVGEFRVKKTLKELNSPDVYSRFISEPEIRLIIWEDTSNIPL